MNEKSHINRSRRSESIGREAAQHDSLEARIPGGHAEKSENRFEDLLEIGRNRGLDCFIEAGKVNAVFTRRFIINASGKVIHAWFAYPIDAAGDFDEGEGWMAKLFPLNMGGRR